MEKHGEISIIPSFSSLLNQNQLLVGSDLWTIAEMRTKEILNVVQPCVLSDRAREEIIHHLQSLIKLKFGTEVLPLGSVPLRTYLPDGAIDLTVFIHPAMEKDLINNVIMFLEAEEQHTKFPVSCVEYVDSQGDKVKCTINDIVVYISFNQVAGLSALCFLEQVDQFIGREHLFKRSVILIKSWCYYESRTLGASHGLLSSYAIETMVSYIISAFHASLEGPLAVLHKFLDYYGKFDWENYCISISGPVAISSLPEIFATPGNEGNGLLLSEEFLRTTREKLLASPVISETSGSVFTIKHLNVVDPLQDSNNLGCNIRKGSFYRIQDAFAYGAKILLKILVHPEENLDKGLEDFFADTLDSFGRGIRPDVQAAISAFTTGKSEVSDLSGDYDKSYNHLLSTQEYCQTRPTLVQPIAPLSPSLVQKGMATTGQIFDKNVFSCKGTEFFVPRSHNSQSSATSKGLEDMGKPRGTGAYMPDMSCIVLKETNSSEKAKNPATGSSSRLMPKAFGKANVSSKQASADVIVDRSMRKSLSVSRKKDTKSSEADQSSPSQENPPAHLEPIQFGSFKHISADEFPVLASSHGGPPKGKQKDNELLGSNEKGFQPYRLDNDKDFPAFS